MLRLKDHSMSDLVKITNEIFGIESVLKVQTSLQKLPAGAKVNFLS